MKVGWLGKSIFLGLTYGEVYTVLSLEKGWLESLTVLVKISLFAILRFRA
jgi:hypothetical protein